LQVSDRGDHGYSEFQFCPYISPKLFLVLNCVFLDERSLTRRRFSDFFDRQNFLGGRLLAFAPLATTLIGGEDSLRVEDPLAEKIKRLYDYICTLQVVQERRRGWQAQMSALTQEWEHKLRCQQQASFRTEQSLLLQLFKLQQENRAMRRAATHAGKSTSPADELRAAKVRLTEA